MGSLINCASYAKGQRVANVEIDHIDEALKQNGQFLWIGLHEPEEELLEKLQEKLGLHDLAVEDAHSAHQRPKIETYGETLFIVLRTAHMKNQHIDFGETHFFLGANFLVTIRHGSSIAYTDIRTRCESTPHLLKKGPGFALYAVMDAIVDQYFPVIDALEQKLSEMEDQIFDEHLRRTTTTQIYQLKHQLLEVKRAVSPLIDICNKLMRFDLKMIDAETRTYFRDVYDHSVRINEMIDSARELLSTALEANLSLISISQSEVARKFAGWAAIIAVPTMVAGVYGMNFEVMPELGWTFGYPFALSIMVVACAALYFMFRRSGWL